MQKNCTIYLARHGQTDWNEKKLIQGQTDILLNKKGELQAKELGEKLKSVKFAAVFSSDLIRAKRSAEIMLLEKKLAVITTKALNERLFGRFEGKHLDELRKVIGEFFSVSKEIQSKYSLSDMENDEEVVARFIPFIREATVAYQGKNVLMVTHGGLLRAFLRHIGFEIPKYTDKQMKNAGYVKVESDGVEFNIKEDRLFENVK